MKMTISKYFHWIYGYLRLQFVLYYIVFTHFVHTNERVSVELVLDTKFDIDW